MNKRERMAFLNMRATDGKSALAIATITGCHQVVALLARHEGADVDAADMTAASTPMHWAGASSACGLTASSRALRSFASLTASTARWN